LAAGDYEIHDDRFSRLIFENAGIDVLWSGGRWCEGPAYFPAGRYLVWSDIPNDRVMRWDDASGAVAIFEQPCRNQNGHTRDRQGRLVACEHGSGSVTRIEHDGRRTVIADRFAGRRLNSPNDVIVRSDDSVWFTDPSYGIDSDYEGDAAPMEQDGRHVYRVDPSGLVTRVVGDMVQPNGLAFSPDETLLYVTDTGRSHVSDCAPRIRRYTVQPGGRSVAAGTDFAFSDAGFFDGVRVDTGGNVWSSAGDGVHCFAPDGTLLGKIRIGEPVANLCFGGPRRNRLFVCATSSLRAVFVNARGLY
jgi:gluconolactonase